MRVIGEDPCDGGAMTFEEFAAGHLSEVLGFAAVLAGDRASAEDIAQETMIRAHRHWTKISSLDRPELYIRKMVVNEFLSSRCRLWRLVPSGRGSDLDDRLTPDHASSYAEQDALLSELRKLPRRQRAVLVLRGPRPATSSAGTDGSSSAPSPGSPGTGG
jgi:DNA-directed RNA polymerase specialized sigma24 family protein